MKKQPLIFAEIKTPVGDRRLESGIYTSLDWSKIYTRAKIRVYPPSYGSPLLEEKGSKEYSFTSSVSAR